MFSERLDPEHQRQGDHKEGFNIRNFVNGNAFEKLPPVFDEEKDFLEGFSRACHSTAMKVLEAFAIALEIPESEGGVEWFTKCHRYDAMSGEVLRFLKYPHGGEASYQEVIRAGAHSDYGSITLLFQKDVPGLEVQASREAWISAPLIDDSVLVNVGDQMQEWTGGLLKSTMHRVTFLPEHNHLDRYSIPFFVHPEDDTPLVPIPSKLVVGSSTDLTQDGKVLTAGQHLRRRLDATYSYAS
ncbi:Clavaminate synthase-like protein [Hesseltinella vesiculosa]|uniref:Clavaminate synthase-like protein n=1 Tax=Hesseltinella vesiculosa TaxID=101127 RepID=A0A1X2GLA4_9FUNG|nr:Clavaminate synthase-like protein [Hesseltinella vesiculosa]